MLPQLGHLVAAGRRGPPARSSTRRLKVQLHQRGRRRRHDPLAQEHHGPVAGAGVPPHLGHRRPRVALRGADSPRPRPPRRSPPWSTPTTPSFLAPGDMPARIVAAFCRRTGQAPPADEGAFVRCCLESLALKYRWTIERLEEIIGAHDPDDPRRRRRHHEHAALPVHGRRLRPPGPRRPGRGHRHRQHPDAGHGPEPARLIADLRAVVARSFPVTICPARPPPGTTPPPVRPARSRPSQG